VLERRGLRSVHQMGACLAGICGGEAPKAREVQSQGCSIAGYESYGTWEEPKPEPEKPAPPPPAPAAPAPPPEPPKPEKPPNTFPITLDVLQGEWVNSMGAKIKVEGTSVSLNGLVMKMHPVILREDGTVQSVGKLWQCKGWMSDDRIEFKEAPSAEVMEFARSVIWSPATEEKMKAWTEQMNSLGYGGSSQDVLNRGVEGCCPGTCDAKAQLKDDDPDKDRKELKLLNDTIQKFREPGMFNIPPKKVIPDFSNRGHTGLSVEHVHYLAKSFKERGFIKRHGNTGHDIPVLVRETTSTELGKKSVANWREKLEDEPGFPPKEHYERLFSGSEVFTSLGNGHFNQALNLFYNESKSIYADWNYEIGQDKDLYEAVHTGVQSIVLRPEISLRERETISKLLNSKREFKWNVNADGSLNILDAAEDTTQCKQFEALSKVLDAVELNCLVRTELGIKDSDRIGH